ncbi:WD repeat-containing protein 41 [Erpetoichthys calabaricus]|uniref:WD repeat domain 41 n=1 Tax=Erpetoichthys calabaricus TaxID=27687 RepID=A0A8C4RTP2_ERPCA|nr:WD repeat-containing protein 41 [Erpetoichthys calabaricus]
MLRWLLGGREAQGPAEKTSLLFIGEEQPKNCYTELQVLKGHFDIVRFLVQIDDFRFASADDDGLVFVWNIQTGERLHELRGHTQQITAITGFKMKTADIWCSMILTASSDRTISLWDVDNGNRVHTVSELQSSVKCLLALERLDLWLSGGNDLCVWNRNFELLCKMEPFTDAGITTFIELPKNCIVAAVDKELIIYRLTLSTCDEQKWDIQEIRRLRDHQDNIRALINVNDWAFASGSHIGEVIIWDSLSWMIIANTRVFAETANANEQPEIKITPFKQQEMSIQHLASDGEYVVAAVGNGIYLYNLLTRNVTAYKKNAHDSNVLQILKFSEKHLISCSEDGSVRMWELQDLPLAAEPASSGFFGMWGFGRPTKPTSQHLKKTPESAPQRTLELMGDLIGHSGAVQMFLYFKDNGLVTCSADNLIILWKDGARESRLRSIALFQKLEQNSRM